MTFSIQLINNYLSSSHCKRILVKDGISSPYFAIKKNPGFFSELFLEVDSLKNKCPEIRTSFSILKNLDHYQYLICNLIPNTVDTDPYKKFLQKLRFLIILSFAKFFELLDNKNLEQIEQWNLVSKNLLEVVSETVNYFRQGTNFEDILDEIKLEEELFDYLKMQKKIIDDVLDQYYL